MALKVGLNDVSRLYVGANLVSTTKTGAVDTGGGVPAGYTRSTMNGVQFTYNGAPVFDNSPTTPLSVRTA